HRTPSTSLRRVHFGGRPRRPARGSSGSKVRHCRSVRSLRAPIATLATRSPVVMVFLVVDPSTGDLTRLWIRHAARSRLSKQALVGMVPDMRRRSDKFNYITI